MHLEQGGRGRSLLLPPWEHQWRILIGILIGIHMVAGANSYHGRIHLVIGAKDQRISNMILYQNNQEVVRI